MRWYAGKRGGGAAEAGVHRCSSTTLLLSSGHPLRAVQISIYIQAASASLPQLRPLHLWRVSGGKKRDYDVDLVRMHFTALIFPPFPTTSALAARHRRRLDRWRQGRSQCATALHAPAKARGEASLCQTAVFLIVTSNLTEKN